MRWPFRGLKESPFFRRRGVIVVASDADPPSSGEMNENTSQKSDFSNQGMWVT